MNPTPSQPERPEPPEGYRLLDVLPVGRHGLNKKDTDMYWDWASESWRFVEMFYPHYYAGVQYATCTAPEAVAVMNLEIKDGEIVQAPTPPVEADKDAEITLFPMQLTEKHEGPFSVKGDNPPHIVCGRGYSVLGMMWPVHEQTPEGEAAAVQHVTEIAEAICTVMNGQEYGAIMSAADDLRILSADLATARATIAELQKDANRYRYLREHRCIENHGDGWLSLSFDCREQYNSMTKKMQGEALDSAIDAALAHAAKEQA